MNRPKHLDPKTDPKTPKKMDKSKHLGLRIDPETHRKFKYLVEFEGRSMNGEVLYLIRREIAEHERKYGKIEKIE